MIQSVSSQSSPTTAHASAVTQPEYFVRIPTSLLTDLRDSLTAIGVYVLIARLFFVTRQPVPLSACDVMRYDPCVHPGAATRALARLVAAGWLIEQSQPGTKSVYTPSWGTIAGAPRPWDAAAPYLGRPRHIPTLSLDRTLLDLFMGRLDTHPHHPALVERYVPSPLLGLRDVGAYALTQYGISTSTPALERLGLVRHGRTVPVPPQREVLARISQDAMSTTDPVLTDKGWRALGIAPRPAADASAPGTTLAFVPKNVVQGQLGELITELTSRLSNAAAGGMTGEVIGGMIGGMIGRVIGCDAATDTANTASECLKVGTTLERDIDTGSRGTKGNMNPPPDSLTVGNEEGGGMSPNNKKQESDPIPNTETARLLRRLNVRPAVVAELADYPAELIKTAIEKAKKRPDIRNIAGWVVSVVRDVYKRGWKLDCDESEFEWFTNRKPQQPDDIGRENEDRTAAGSDTRTAPDEIEVHADQSDESVPDEHDQRANGASERAAPHGITYSAAALTEAFRQQLQRRMYAQQWRAISDITACMDGPLLRLHCRDKAQLATVQSEVLPMIRSVLADIGLPTDLQVVASLPVLPTPPDPEPGADRPDWIPADVWSTLSRTVRVMLLGSTYQGGEVQGATPSLTRLLQTRFAADLERVLQARAAS